MRYFFPLIYKCKKWIPNSFIVLYYYEGNTNRGTFDFLKGLMGRCFTYILGEGELN